MPPSGCRLRAHVAPQQAPGAYVPQKRFGINPTNPPAFFVVFLVLFFFSCSEEPAGKVWGLSGSLERPRLREAGESPAENLASPRSTLFVFPPCCLLSAGTCCYINRNNYQHNQSIKLFIGTAGKIRPPKCQEGHNILYSPSPEETLYEKPEECRLRD